MTVWMFTAGDMSAIASEIGVSLPFGLQADPAEGGSLLDGVAPLHVASEPEGARVLIDGHERGRTPLMVRVAPGSHTLVLKHPDALDEARRVDIHEGGTALSLQLWQRRARVVQLRPTYPGATLADATFLTDGRIALSITLPERESAGMTGSWREAWLLDPSTGRVSRFDTAGFAAPRSPVLAVSPDGLCIAYLQQAPPRPDQAITQGSRLDEVWVASADGGSLVRAFGVPAVGRAGPYGTTEVERLVDLEWAPDGRRVLVATHIGEPLSGPVRGRLLVVEANQPGRGGSVTAPVELVTMPATIMPGSYSWGPDGQWVAFLARASSAPGGKNVVTLNAVDTRAETGSGFRYLADLGRADGSGGPASLPVPPVAWEPLGLSSASVGRLLYAAPIPAGRNGVGAGPFGLLAGAPPEPSQGLFLVAPDGPALAPEQQRRVGSATGLYAPVWRATEPGVATPAVLSLARANGDEKALAIRAVDPTTGRVQDLGVQLPADVAPGASAVGARWDEARGRLIVVARPASGRLPAAGGAADGLDFWLVQFKAATQAIRGGSH